MQAIQYVRSVPRYLVVRALARGWPGVATGPLGLIRLADVAPPRLPSAEWLRVRVRLAGICGSDLATLTAQGSTYFSPFVSTPFVLGHELVGTVSEIGGRTDDWREGERVVLEPALGCAVRAIAPPCPACRAGRHAACENVARGIISPGIQTGYCRETGGAWSEELVAHRSQLFRVPASLSDEVAVLAEPFACALHGVLRSRRLWAPSDEEQSAPPTVLLLGCGTLGLLALAALRALEAERGGELPRARVLAAALLEHQAELARQLGADEVLRVGQGFHAGFAAWTGAERFQSELHGPVFLGGSDVTFECVGLGATLAEGVRLTREHGELLLLGMPGVPRGVDWTGVWHKSLDVRGSYAYGTESWRGERLRTFALALRLLERIGARVAPLVGARFRLAEYPRAVAVALGRTGLRSIKTVFDLRPPAVTPAPVRSVAAQAPDVAPLSEALPT